MGKWVGSSATSRARSCVSTRSRDGFVRIESGNELTLTTDDATIGSRRAAAGRLGRPHRRRRARATRSTSPTAGSACGRSRSAATRSAAWSRPAAGRLPPGRQPARAAVPGCPPPGPTTWAGSTSRSITRSTCSRSRSSARPRTSSRSTERLAERHADIPLIAKIEKPQAAEQAEEIIEAATQRDHGRARRPRDRVADRGRPGNPEAADPPRRQAIEAGRSRRRRCSPRW